MHLSTATRARVQSVFWDGAIFFFCSTRTTVGLIQLYCLNDGWGLNYGELGENRHTLVVQDNDSSVYDTHCLSKTMTTVCMTHWLSQTKRIMCMTYTLVVPDNDNRVYVSTRLLKSDVSGWKALMQLVTVNVAQWILFSGLHSANAGTLRMNK